MEKSTFNRIILILMMAIVASCSNDDGNNVVTPEEEQEEPQTAEDLQALKDLLIEANNNEEPITSITSENEMITGFELEKQGSIQIVNDLITSIETDDEDWTANLVFEDSSTLTVFYVGNETGVSIDIELNPFDNAPLAAVSI
ncbi:MAG: hypothetical protein WA913_01255, partial [Pricia sp.]